MNTIEDSLLFFLFVILSSFSLLAFPLYHPFLFFLSSLLSPSFLVCLFHPFLFFPSLSPSPHPFLLPSLHLYHSLLFFLFIFFFSLFSFSRLHLFPFMTDQVKEEEWRFSGFKQDALLMNIPIYFDYFADETWILNNNFVNLYRSKFNEIQ